MTGPPPRSRAEPELFVRHRGPYFIADPGFRLRGGLEGRGVLGFSAARHYVMPSGALIFRGLSVLERTTVVFHWFFSRGYESAHRQYTLDI
jgi:hypothetical protein